MAYLENADQTPFSLSIALFIRLALQLPADKVRYDLDPDNIAHTGGRNPRCVKASPLSIRTRMHPFTIVWITDAFELVTYVVKRRSRVDCPPFHSYRDFVVSAVVRWQTMLGWRQNPPKSPLAFNSESECAHRQPPA